MKNFNFKIREWIKFKVLRPMLLGLGNSMGPYSAVGMHPVYDNSDFPWTVLLETNYPVIRKELEKVLVDQERLPSLQQIQREQEVLNQDNRWQTFFLYGFGTKVTRNCALCPETTSLLEQIPDMKTAFFSVLAPGKHIPAHKGLFKGIIRSHLGMIIPGRPGDCRMRIEEREIHWKEGEVVVFDDTFDHEVWNDTDKTRVVLLIDVLRPFRGPLAWLNRAVVKLIGKSSFVPEAMKNHRQWEARFYARQGVT
ncbi:MAG: aspartyl/asparaginyl beta-hydroxylase domain-containing protein [Robiginitalea sp.]